MTSLGRLSVYALIVLVLLIVLMGFVQATKTYFTVQVGEEIIHPVNLSVEDRVLIQFTVVGETSNTLHFSIIFPNATVRDFEELGDFRYSFICDVEGKFSLNYTNNDQMGNKLVTLNYEIQHYIFGIPQMLFLTLIIALACVGGVVAFVLLGRSYH